MDLAEKYPSNIYPLNPSGTNSTMFTACCGFAICDNETGCPKCKGPVVGDGAGSAHKVRLIRWANATSHWKRGNDGND